MVLKYTLEYRPLVTEEDIPKLSKVDRIQIQQAIERKLILYPDKFGKPLRNKLKGFRKLRVGDCRVIFRIQKFIVTIWAIQHRSIVYKEFLKRLFSTG